MTSSTLKLFSAEDSASLGVSWFSILLLYWLILYFYEIILKGQIRFKRLPDYFFLFSRHLYFFLNDCKSPFGVVFVEPVLDKVEIVVDFRMGFGVADMKGGVEELVEFVLNDILFTVFLKIEVVLLDIVDESGELKIGHEYFVVGDFVELEVA